MIIIQRIREAIGENRRENVDKLQKLEDAQVNQMQQKAIDHVCQLDESG